MSAAGHLPWRPLPLPPSPGLPALLVSAEMGPASYIVRVTDMANIWAESLDRKAICLRGWSENTSIDPSDTPENMARFLATLKSALDSSQPGHGETGLGLSPAAAADAGDDGLTLRVTCALAGLAPLRWPVHLSRSPPSAIATDLVLPLVQAQYARKRQVESLLQALRHKDAVLTKLSDKLEAMGTGLEHVFTALSGRRKVTRSIADDRVKGLAPFDERKWRQDLDSEMDGPADTSHLVQSVFGGPGLQHGNMMAIDKSPALDGWWHRLKKGGLPLSHPRQQTRPAPSPKRTPSPPADAASNQDDDFQVQATPPHLKSAGKPKAARDAPPLDDASTTSDNEEEDNSAARKSIRPAAAAPKSARLPEPTRAALRLGAIGGKTQTAARRSPVPEAKKPGNERAELPADGSETASDAPDDDATASVPGSPSRPPPEPAPTTTGLAKGRLGKIGGGGPKVLGGNMPKSPGAGDAGETDGAPAHKKLGVIGNRTGRGASPPGPSPRGEDKGRGGASTTRTEGDAAEREPRETSQERADRRREELKRDLDRKAAGGPARKKRRF